MRNSTIVLILVVLLGVLGAWSVSGIRPFNTPAPIPGGTACTADAMQCPDGSYVGRSGPNCEFVCPAATSTASSTPPAGGAGSAGGGGGSGTGSGGGGFAQYHSGIRGTVMLGPTCPVMRDPPDPQCADKPYSTTVAVFRAGVPSQPIAIVQSAADGSFQISLPPGDYVVGAGSGQSALPRCMQTPATVGPTGYTTVAVSCDTGIR